METIHLPDIATTIGNFHRRVSSSWKVWQKWSKRGIEIYYGMRNRIQGFDKGSKPCRKNQKLVVRSSNLKADMASSVSSRNYEAVHKLADIQQLESTKPHETKQNTMHVLLEVDPID